MPSYLHYICALPPFTFALSCVEDGECIAETASLQVSLSPPALAFAERRSKSFSRSWSDPTPVKNDSPHEPRESEFTQSHTCAHNDKQTDTNKELLTAAESRRK